MVLVMGHPLSKCGDGVFRSWVTRLNREPDWWCLLRTRDGVLWRNLAWRRFLGLRSSLAEWRTARGLIFAKDYPRIEDAISKALKTQQLTTTLAHFKLDGHRSTEMFVSVQPLPCAVADCTTRCGLVLVHVWEPGSLDPL
jgi:hypothetical protein